MIACIAFDTAQRGGRTVMGDSAERCVRRLTEGGADAIGATVEASIPCRWPRLSLSLRRSAIGPLPPSRTGLPKLLEGQTVFDMEAESFPPGCSLRQGRGDDRWRMLRDHTGPHPCVRGLGGCAVAAVILPMGEAHVSEAAELFRAAYQRERRCSPLLPPEPLGGVDALAAQLRQDATNPVSRLSTVAG